MAKNQNHAAPAPADPDEVVALDVATEILAPEVPAVEPEPEPPSQAVLVKARVLRDCVYGKCDDVVTVGTALLESLAGVVDADPAAVAYAESLAK